MDLGPCPKSHSEKLKLQFINDDSISPDKYMDYHREYESNIRDFVNECDRRIRTAHKRLEKTPEENNKTTALMREIAEIQAAMDQAMQDVESLGESGKVEESMNELQKVEALKEEKTNKEKELQDLSETSGASGHQKLRVCDICGAYLSVLDSDRRLADHFGGKMHLGYFELRKRIEDINASRSGGYNRNVGGNNRPLPTSMSIHPSDPAAQLGSVKLSYEDKDSAPQDSEVNDYQIDPRDQRFSNDRFDEREARREQRYAERRGSLRNRSRSPPNKK